MNPDLDRLFEQARNELRAEMPIESVEQLIHGPVKTSFWKRYQNIIMGTTFIGLIAIAFTLSYNLSPISENIEPSTQRAKIETNNLTKYNPINTTLPIEKTAIAILPIQKNEPTEASNRYPHSINLNTPTKIDSLIPKETFREYKLQISKSNSEKEIKKLQSELERYGIHMEISLLDYDSDNKIKRFAGNFKTDSLFCGASLSNYNFNISGAFSKIEFTFRVAEDSNLKYLKIESDDFEETIECYDDGVISNISEANKVKETVKKEMRLVKEEMEYARFKIEEVMEQFNEDFKFKFDKDFKSITIEIEDELQQLKNKDWKKMGADIRREVEESLKSIRSEDFQQELKEELEELHESLKEIHEEIEEEMKIEMEILEKTRNKSPENMREEAKALKEQAKQLKKEAKRKEKEEKKR